MQKKTTIAKTTFFIVIFRILSAAWPAYAELRIESVTPGQGVAGQELAVTITGTGFDENTRVSMYMDRMIGSVSTDQIYAFDIELSGNIAFVVNEFGGLKVVDVSTPNNPFLIGSVFTPGEAVDLALSANFAFVADAYAGLQVVDVSDPHRPFIIASLPGYNANGVALSGNTAFVTCGGEDQWNGLKVVDVSDPHNPVIIGSISTPDVAMSVALSGNTAFVTCGGYLENEWTGLQIVDVSDPHNPLIIGSVDIPGYAAIDVALSDNLAFVANADAGLQIVDVSDLHNPIIIGSVDTSDYTNGVALSGNTVFMADSDDGLHAVDVSDPHNPLVISSLSIYGVYDVAVHDGYNIVASIYKYALIGIWPIPVEISSVSAAIETSLSLTLPAPAYAGRYTLRVFNKTESSELPGVVTFVPDWAPISAQHSMTVQGDGYFDGEKIESDGYVIAAFGPGGESDCRGKADITGRGENWEYQLTIVSDTDGEEITFQIWNNNTGQIYSVKESLPFEADENMRKSLDMPLDLESVSPDQGTSGQELALTITGTGFDEHTKVSMHLQDGGNRTDIMPVVLTDETHLSVSIPSAAGAGLYTLSASNETKRSELPGAFTLVPNWTPISARYSMTVQGDAYLSGQKIEGDGYVIAAFGPGGESDCRGKADITETEGNWEYHLTVVSDSNGEEISFKIWNSRETRLHSVRDTVVFEADSDITKPLDMPLKLESVSPDHGLVGQELAVTITGDGFDENTRVSMYMTRILDSADTPGYTKYTALSGNFAFVVTDGYEDAGLQVINVSDPRNPVIIASMFMVGYEHVVLSGDVAFMFGRRGLLIVDVSDPCNPSAIGSVETHTPPDYWYFDLLLSGNLVFLMADGYAVHIVDVSDPHHPVVIGTVDTSGSPQDMRLSGDLAFVADSYGLQIVDVSDPQNPLIIGSVDTPGSARSVALSGDLAFVTGEGLYIVDVSDPHHPIIVGSLDVPGHGYDLVSCDLVSSGYFVFVEDYLHIVDVSDPHHPVIIGTAQMPDHYARDVTVSGDTLYANFGDQLLTVSLARISPITVRSETEIALTLPPPDQAGSYTLAVFNGMKSRSSLRSVIFDDPPCVKGDLSGDGQTSLGDAILALQTVAGSDILPACSVPFIDVNGDGKIGLAEVIYILRDVAGMR